MPNERAIRTLNGLIEVSKDGEIGFRTAWEKVSEAALQQDFKAMSQSCAKAAAQLENAVRALGAQPTTTGTARGALHRGWIAARTTVSGNPTEALLEEVVRGEEYAVRRYEEALQAGLPAVIHAMVEAQAQGARQNLARARLLRDRVAAAL